MKKIRKGMIFFFVCSCLWIVFVINYLMISGWWQNRFNALQKENERVKEYQESYKKELDYWRIQFSNKEDRIDKAVEEIQYIIDYGFDYDGFNNVKDLKGLIDMLVDYARKSKNILQGDDKE